MMILPTQKSCFQPLLWTSATFTEEQLDIHGSQGTSAPQPKTQQTALTVYQVLNKYLLGEHTHEQHCQLSAKGGKSLKNDRLSASDGHPNFCLGSQKDTGQIQSGL